MWTLNATEPLASVPTEGRREGVPSMGPETGLKIAGVGVGKLAGGWVEREEYGQCGP